MMRKHFTQFTPVMISVVFAFLFFSFVGNVNAQTGAEAPVIPSAQDISASLNLDQFSAPAVDIVVSASGVVGTAAVLSAKTNNISDNASDFQWYLDDKLMSLQSGRTRTTFSFQTVKQLHVVRLIITENGQKVAENSASISSFSVSVVWSTDTFVPADYEGKALPIVGSLVTLTAIPDIRGENPEDLLYTWYVDSESRVRGVANEQSFSFYVTKNVLYVPVVVEVSNAGQSILVRQAITIPVMRPAVLLYHAAEKSTALSPGAFSMNPGEKTNVYARPFYFHIRQASDLSYQWRFANANAAGTPPDPDLLLLSVPENSGSGETPLTVSAESFIVPGERAKTELPITIL